jgi:PAS domain S-box-containing protein
MQIEVSAQQLDYEGRPVLFSVNRDITERKRAQEELAGQKTMLQEILDTSSVAIFLLDKAGRITKANRRMAEMFGRHLEAMAGMEYVELVHPSEREVGRAKMLALLASKIPSVDLERHYRRKDGTEFWGHLTGRRFHDVHGNELGLIGVISDITGRKRAEDKLKESEAWLNTILDNVGAYIFIKDTQYRYTYVNRKVCELFGMTPDDILGKGDDAFFSAASVEEVKRSDRPVIERGETVAREEFGLTPLSGMARTYWTVKLPLRDAGGAITGLCGISTDITEHKQAEVALRKSERMLQMIIDTEPDCIKLIDEESRLLMMNRAGLDMLQVDSLEQVKGQFVCPLVAPEYQQAFRDLTRRVFQGETGSLEFKMTGLQGRQVWLETHAVPLRNEKEEVAALLGVTRDITERKNAEHALRQSEARFRAMIESASIGILVADIETRKFLYANPEICRLLGYSEQEFHSLSATDLAIPEELPDSIEGFQAHVEGQLKATERTFRRKDGSTVKMSINSVRMEFDGRPSLVGFFTDITEKLLLEEERLKAQKLESIGTLAGGIAHDFNNLLQGIFGYISMAKLTIDQREKSLAMLVQAEKALHQSVNLTSQLLTFSKGGKPVKKVIDLRTVIEDSVKFALSGSRVSYELSFGDDLCAVEADEGQIGQVVQNIILNAEQAMPLGGRIEIAARCVPPFQASGLALTAPDGLVEIVVRDQGTGIPPEHLPRIFDPYFTTKEKGSGLGLATAYSIVKNHDGMISVASELGKGSTFTIYLPATREVLGSAAASVSARCATGKKCRVLVMDDEPVVRVVAGELLRELGHEVEFAEHGDSAIEKYRRAKAEGRPFDAVILDLTIRGGKGGAEAMRELLAIDPGVKAIVSSGYSGDEVVATYRQHGFRAFLKKPYDMRELGRILDDVMA